MVLHGVEAITTWIICHFSKTVPIEFTNVASIYFYHYWEGDEMKWKWWLLVTHSFYENNFFKSCCCNMCSLSLCFLQWTIFLYISWGFYLSIWWSCEHLLPTVELWWSLSNFRQKTPWNWIVTVNRIRT